jgi:hypothetical protein
LLLLEEAGNFSARDAPETADLDNPNQRGIVFRPVEQRIFVNREEPCRFLKAESFMSERRGHSHGHGFA